MDTHAFEPSAASAPVRSSELLGFPPDTRVLIVNNDDFGMYHAINAAVIASIEDGIASSCSLMVPCPWARHAMHLLRERPEIPFGIHLTLFCDTIHFGWGPLTAREKVPSLLDESGELFTPAQVPDLVAQARLEEVELEFRAQINAVLDAGLSPTHLDSPTLAPTVTLRSSCPSRSTTTRLPALTAPDSTRPVTTIPDPQRGTRRRRPSGSPCR